MRYGFDTCNERERETGIKDPKVAMCSVFTLCFPRLCFFFEWTAKRFETENLDKNVQVEAKLRFNLGFRKTWNIPVEPKLSSFVSSFSFDSQSDCSHWDIRPDRPARVKSD